MRTMLKTRGNQVVRYNRGLIAETGIIPDGAHLLRDSYSFKVTKIKKDVVQRDPLYPAKTVSEDRKTMIEEPIMRVTGLFQQSGLKNANGRVYPRAVMANAIQSI